MTARLWRRLRAPFACIAFAILLLPCFAAPAAVAQEADLIISKSGPATAAANSNVTYTITIFSAGPDNVPASLDDNIPGGMTFVSLSAPGGWSCSTPGVGNPGAINCTNADFTAGGNDVFSLVVNIPPGTAPGTTFTNIATVSSPADPTEENNSSTAVTTVPGAASADVAILKNGPSAAPPDSNITYTLTVVNAGPDTATNVSLTDTLPGTMTFVSLSSPAGWSCTTPSVGSGGTITCTNASFAAAGNANFSLTAHIPSGTPAGTQFDNTANVTSNEDPEPGNNSATIATTVSAADLAIVKSGPASVAHGQNITYTVTVSNNGPDFATGVIWLDTLTTVTFVSLTQNTGPTFSCTAPGPGNTGAVNCSTGSLNSGQSAQFTLVVNSGNDPSASRSNTATVSSDAGDPDSGNNSSTATTTLTASADLTIAKTGPATVSQNGQIIYTITTGHAGGSAATGVSMTDSLPAGVTFTSLASPAGWSCTAPAVGQNGTVTCNKGSVAVGEQGVFTLTGNVTAGSGTVLSNTATIASATNDPNGGNNSASATTTVTPPLVDLTIAKTHTGTAVRGSPFQYTITVSNVGGGASAGTVTVTDTLPAGLTASAIAGAGWACSLAGTPTCTRADTLAQGGSYPPITLTVNVASNAPASVTNTAVVSGGGDNSPGNNTATDPTTVQTAAPTARSVEVTMLAGTTKTVDLTVGATGGPFTGANLVSLSPADAGTASISQQNGTFILTFTPAPRFTGRAVVTFTLSNSSGTSAPATVTFTVVPRPDPSKDPEVLGLINSQIAAAERFASAQISNFNQRLESLHEDGYGTDQQGISGGNTEQRSANAYVTDAFGELPGSMAYADGTRPGSASKAMFDRMARAEAQAQAREQSRRSGPRSPFSVWSSGYVSFGSANDAIPGSGFDFTTSGVTVGADYRFNPMLTAGIGIGYGRDRSTIGLNGTRSEAETYSISLYESFRPYKGYFIDGVLGFGTLDYDSQRFVTHTGGFAFGSRSGTEWFGSLTAGYEYRNGRLLLSPYARMKAVWLNLGAFTEFGDPTGSLAFEQQDVSTVTGVLGLRGKYDFLFEWGQFSPRFRVELNHAISDGGAAALSYADWIGGPTYLVPTFETSSTFALVGLGTDFKLANDLFVNFDYQTTINAFDTHSHLFQFRGGKRF